MSEKLKFLKNGYSLQKDKPQLNLITFSIATLSQDGDLYVKRDDANEVIQKWHDKEFKVGFLGNRRIIYRDAPLEPETESPLGHEIINSLGVNEDVKDVLLEMLHKIEDLEKLK